MKRDGKLLVVAAGDAQPGEVVATSWTGSLAAVMRSIGVEFMTFPDDYPAHVALRQKIEGAYRSQIKVTYPLKERRKYEKRAVPVAHIAVGAFLIMQGGATAGQVAGMADGRLVDYARGMNLV